MSLPPSATHHLGQSRQQRQSTQSILCNPSLFLQSPALVFYFLHPGPSTSNSCKPGPLSLQLPPPVALPASHRQDPAATASASADVLYTGTQLSVDKKTVTRQCGAPRNGGRPEASAAVFRSGLPLLWSLTCLTWHQGGPIAPCTSNLQQSSPCRGCLARRCCARRPACAADPLACVLRPLWAPVVYSRSFMLTYNTKFRNARRKLYSMLDEHPHDPG